MPRRIKIVAMGVALGMSLYAYNNHDGFYFAPIMAAFCAIITTLVTIEYWDDQLLRLISGTLTLCTYNNLTDEIFFDPYTFSTNEKIFALIISINFIYNIFAWIRIHSQS